MENNGGKNRKQTFALAAPDATRVLLAGDFTEWEKHPIALVKNGQGMWSKTVKLPPGLHHYRFLVDGQWQDDPACAERVANAFGSQDCVCQAG